MPEQEFGKWYDWVKEKVAEYQDVESRTAIISGFFAANHKEVFTGDQVSQILDLGFQKEERAPINEAATSGRTKKITNSIIADKAQKWKQEKEKTR